MDVFGSKSSPVSRRVPRPVGAAGATGRSQSASAVTSLSCGLLAVITSALLIALPSSRGTLVLTMAVVLPPALGLVGVAAAIRALRRGHQHGHRHPHGRGLAITGLLTSALTLLGWTLFWLFVLIASYALSHAKFTY